jgi:LacI family transcriptional regulator
LGRPTITDLASAAGVSLATVDRVLNSRPGVRQETVSRVNEAIERIGFVRDPFAANLARKRDFHVIALLPDGESQFLAALRAAVGQTAQSLSTDRVALTLQTFRRQDPNQLAAQLDQVSPDAVDGVALMAPETPQTRDAVRRLRARGVPVAAILSDLPHSHRDFFIGINNINAGRTAAGLMGRFLGRGPARVAVLTGSLQEADSLDRRLGFDAAMAEHFPQIEVLPTLEGHDDPVMLEQALRRVLERHPDLRGVYSMGGGNRVMLDVIAGAALQERPCVIAHELTETTRAGLLSGLIDAVITQDLGHILRSAIRQMRAGRDARPIVPEQERIRIEIVLRDNLF